jgi:hypothetical protein
MANSCNLLPTLLDVHIEEEEMKDFIFRQKKKKTVCRLFKKKIPAKIIYLNLCLHNK